MENCINGVDEDQCEWTIDKVKRGVHMLRPVLVNFSDSGIHISNFNTNVGSRLCPETHFQCPGELLCLPVYVICNGVLDCPGHEDEAECEKYSVPSFYRCRASHIHLHPSHMCDGFGQCPEIDDELFCKWSCPVNCMCYGSALFCEVSFHAKLYSELRFVEGRGSGMKPADFANNTMLIHLGLASCGLIHLRLPMLHNLHSLDLSNNRLHSVNSQEFKAAGQLKRLSLSGNPLNDQSLGLQYSLLSLTTLDLSNLDLPVLDMRFYASLPNVQSINLSQSGVKKVSGNAFQTLKKLEVLDLSGCPFTHFPHDVFSGLQRLRIVYSDNYKVCCSAILPRGFNMKNCHAPSDEVSSCNALLHSNMYRVLLAMFAVLSLLGNFLSFVYRVLMRNRNKSAFSVFVICLSVADFLMGVYLAIIGVADGLYRGSYLWKDEDWKHSAVCKVAGVLSLMSSEVSAFIICLITLDRFLVLQFPFSRCRFSHRSALVMCAVVWCGGLILAVLPLLPGLSHWEYYSQTGICIPLPITKKTFDGHKYSFGLMIILNFIIFLFIAVGQLIIFWSIRTNTMGESDAVTNRKSKDLTIARRLLTVATSDFLCWFPVGLLGLLASRGVAIPGEVNVAMAITVLPLNSALNPFLYTLNLIQERRRKTRELRLQKHLMAQERQQVESESCARGVVDKLKLSYTKQGVVLLLERWLRDRLLSKEQVIKLLES